MVDVRRATPADAASAASIIANALAEHALPFEPRGRDADVASFGARDDHDDMVALLDGEIAGVVDVGPQGDPGVAWVSKLFVKKSARRCGIGRVLLRAAHDAARARGHHEVRLRTRRVFEAAIALYEAEGYRLFSDGGDPENVVLSRPL
jgi:GNAT superfamily N-acetyltransferase